MALVPAPDQAPDNVPDFTNYRIIRKLGQGGFGTTFLTEDHYGHQYAVKLIDYQAAIDMGLSASEIVEESSSLRALSEKECNPYMICYHGSWDFDYHGRRYIVIVSDFVDGLTIRDWLNQSQYRGGRVPPQVLWPIITQMFWGLQYIHSKGYAHRDIKPENIMLSRDLDVKYIDFGLACTRNCVYGRCYDSCQGRVGTLLYDPPEMFDGTYKENLSGAQKRDIWSLLLVCYELVGGNASLPFTALDSAGQWLPDDEIIHNIVTQTLEYPTYQFDDGRTSAFLYRNLIRDPNLRPTINQLLERWNAEVIGRPLVLRELPMMMGNRQIRQQLRPVTYPNVNI